MSVVVLFLLVASMPQGVDKPPPVGNIWFGLLASDEPADFRLLISAAPQAIDEFEAILNNPESTASRVTRLYGVLASAKIDHKRFFTSALRDLSHPNASVRMAAADYAGHVGGVQFAAPLLMQAFHDPKADVCNAARRAVTKIGDEGTVAALDHFIRFGGGRTYEPADQKVFVEVYTKTRDEIKARLAAAKPAPPKS